MWYSFFIIAFIYENIFELTNLYVGLVGEANFYLSIFKTTSLRYYDTYISKCSYGIVLEFSFSSSWEYDAKL
jgi:hypothetical protein